MSTSAFKCVSISEDHYLSLETSSLRQPDQNFLPCLTKPIPRRDEVAFASILDQHKIAIQTQIRDIPIAFIMVKTPLVYLILNHGRLCSSEIASTRLLAEYLEAFVMICYSNMNDEDIRPKIELAIAAEARIINELVKTVMEKLAWARSANDLASFSEWQIRFTHTVIALYESLILQLVGCSSIQKEWLSDISLFFPNNGPTIPPDRVEIKEWLSQAQVIINAKLKLHNKEPSGGSLESSPLINGQPYAAVKAISELYFPV